MLIARLQLGLVLMLVMPLPAPNLSLMWQILSKRQQASSNRQRGVTEPGSFASSSRNTTFTASSNSRGASNSTNSTPLVAGYHPVASSSSSSGASSASSTSWVVWYYPAMYWQQPRLRLFVIMCQRVLPPLSAALSVGYITSRFFELTSLRYWPMVEQCAFLGWKGFMLVVSACSAACKQAIAWHALCWPIT
jgi:hypothetical protein